MAEASPDGKVTRPGCHSNIRNLGMYRPLSNLTTPKTMHSLNALVYPVHNSPTAGSGCFRPARERYTTNKLYVIKTLQTNHPLAWTILKR